MRKSASWRLVLLLGIVGVAEGMLFRERHVMGTSQRLKKRETPPNRANYPSGGLGTSP